MARAVCPDRDSAGFGNSRSPAQSIPAYRLAECAPGSPQSPPEAASTGVHRDLSAAAIGTDFRAARVSLEVANGDGEITATFAATETAAGGAPSSLPFLASHYGCRTRTGTGGFPLASNHADLAGTESVGHARAWLRHRATAGDGGNRARG